MTNLQHLNCLHKKEETTWNENHFETMTVAIDIKICELKKGLNLLGRANKQTNTPQNQTKTTPKLLKFGSVEEIIH